MTQRRRLSRGSREDTPSFGEGILKRLRDSGIYLRKERGQHLLLDPRLLASVVGAGDLQANDRVLEVGTGTGALTRLLCEQAGEVVSVELDKRLAEFARKELQEYPNVEILCADILDRKGEISRRVLERIAGWPSLKLLSNLPYQVATPVVLNLFALYPRVSLAVVTVQKEVADRLCAARGTRSYGPATLLLGYWAETTPLRTLPPGAFSPPPKVSSRVIRIASRESPLGQADEFPGFAHWVQRLYSQRRKQVGGLLRKDLGPERAKEALQWMQVPESARAENLSPEQFLILARRSSEVEFS